MYLLFSLLIHINKIWFLYYLPELNEVHSPAICWVFNFQALRAVQTDNHIWVQSQLKSSRKKKQTLNSVQTANFLKFIFSFSLLKLGPHFLYRFYFPNKNSNFIDYHSQDFFFLVQQSQFYWHTKTIPCWFYLFLMKGGLYCSHQKWMIKPSATKKI